MSETPCPVFAKLCTMLETISPSTAPFCPGNALGKQNTTNKMKTAMTLTLLCVELLPDPTRISVSVSWLLLNPRIGSYVSQNAPLILVRARTGSKCLLPAILPFCHLLHPFTRLSYPGLGLLAGPSFYLSSAISSTFLSLGTHLLVILPISYLPVCFNVLLTSGSSFCPPPVCPFHTSFPFCRYICANDCPTLLYWTNTVFLVYTAHTRSLLYLQVR